MNKDNKCPIWWEHKANMTTRLRKVAREHGVDVAFYIIALIDVMAQKQGCFIKAKPVCIACALGFEDDLELGGKVLLAIDDCPHDIIRKIKVSDAMALDFEVLDLIEGEYIISSPILDDAVARMKRDSNNGRNNANSRWEKYHKEQERQADKLQMTQSKPKRTRKEIKVKEQKANVNTENPLLRSNVQGMELATYEVMFKREGHSFPIEYEAMPDEEKIRFLQGNVDSFPNA